MVLSCVASVWTAGTHRLAVTYELCDLLYHIGKSEATKDKAMVMMLTLNKCSLNGRCAMFRFDEV